MDKFKFTKARLEKLPVPDKPLQNYHDANKPGLVLRITNKGTCTFYHYRRVAGTPAWMRIGRFPDISVDVARKAVESNNEQIAQGEDPNKQKREKRGELTFQKLFDEYLEGHAKLNKKTWKEDQGQFDRHLTGLANKRISEVEKADIRAIHKRLRNKPHAANRTLAMILKMYRYAHDELDLDIGNPAEGIDKYSVKSRDRFLQPDEVGRFIEAVHHEETMWFVYFMLALFTGARRGNLSAMRWEQLDLEHAIWSIPETKNGEPLHIPLVAPALELLTLWQDDVAGPWVFPSKGKTGHVAEPRKAIERIRTRAKLPGIRLHDLRRSLGSWQAAQGSSLIVIGKSLGRKSHEATQIYACLHLDPVRTSMEQATGAMLGVGNE